MTNHFVVTYKQKQFHKVPSYMVSFLCCCHGLVLCGYQVVQFLRIFWDITAFDCKYQFLEIYQGMFCKPRPILYGPVSNDHNLYLCVICISVISRRSGESSLLYILLHDLIISCLVKFCVDFFWLKNSLLSLFIMLFIIKWLSPSCLYSHLRMGGELHNTTVFTHKKPVFTFTLNLHFLFPWHRQTIDLHYFCLNSCKFPDSVFLLT